MKPEEIIELAKKSGLVYQDSSGDVLNPFQEWVDIFPYIKDFAALIAAAEREECAKVCDAEATIEGIAQRCAAAIRARGEK